MPNKSPTDKLAAIRTFAIVAFGAFLLAFMVFTLSMTYRLGQARNIASSFAQTNTPPTLSATSSGLLPTSTSVLYRGEYPTSNGGKWGGPYMQKVLSNQLGDVTIEFNNTNKPYSANSQDYLSMLVRAVPLTESDPNNPNPTTTPQFKDTYLTLPGESITYNVYTKEENQQKYKFQIYLVSKIPSSNNPNNYIEFTYTYPWPSPQNCSEITFYGDGQITWGTYNKKEKFTKGSVFYIKDKSHNTNMLGVGLFVQDDTTKKQEEAYRKGATDDSITGKYGAIQLLEDKTVNYGFFSKNSSFSTPSDFVTAFVCKS